MNAPQKVSAADLAGSNGAGAQQKGQQHADDRAMPAPRQQRPTEAQIDAALRCLEVLHAAYPEDGATVLHAETENRESGILVTDTSGGCYAEHADEGRALGAILDLLRSCRSAQQAAAQRRRDVE
jgi:hypothetical protein